LPTSPFETIDIDGVGALVRNVSCSPYRIPVARVAAARAALD
jgi:hypothetical protein